MPRLRLVLLLVASLALLGAKADDFDVRVLLATLSLGMLLMLAKYIVERDRALLRFEARVDTALWGLEDANGKRDVESGIVAGFQRLALDLPRAIAAAESAARSAELAAVSAQSAAESANLAADEVSAASRRVEEAATYAVLAGDSARTAQELMKEHRDSIAQRRGPR